MRLRGCRSACSSGFDPLGPWRSPAVVGATVPIAVLAVPVRVLAVHWGRAPWRLGAPDTVLVLSRDMGESLSIRERGGGGQKGSHRFITDSHSSRGPNFSSWFFQMKTRLAFVYCQYLSLQITLIIHIMSISARARVLCQSADSCNNKLRLTSTGPVFAVFF